MSMNEIRLYRKMSKAVNPYGDGKAAEKIVKHLDSFERLLAER
jgi:UDP-N-acetylglucosamine 2-epimerase